MEETVKELKEDLKNAREMISCLNETVKNLMKTKKQDDDTNSKMDKILEKLETYNQLETKVDFLKEELLKSQGYISHFLESHEEINRKMDNLRDSVETTVGYSELFVKDFERIHGKLDENNENSQQLNIKMEQLLEKSVLEEEKLNFLKDTMTSFQKRFEHLEGNMDINTVRMEQISQTQLEIKEKHVEFVARLENGDLSEKTEKILSEIKYVRSMIPEPMFECVCGCFSPKERLLREDGVSIECPSCERLQIVGALYEGRKWMCHEECGHYQQYPLDLREGCFRNCQICGQSGKLRDLVLKCHNFVCKSVLPKDLPLREDGVIVECSKCQFPNIIGTLKEGEKWMVIDGCGHFLQVPLDKEKWTKEKCPYCENEGILIDANDCVSSYS